MKKIFFFAFVTRKLLKFIESLSHVNFCQTKFFFLRIQVLAITRCIETYDIYHRDVSEMYELCSNKRSEILLVVWNVCLWNTERSASKMSLLKLSFELSNNTKTHCCFSDQRIKIRWYPRIYVFWTKYLVYHCISRLGQSLMRIKSIKKDILILKCKDITTYISIKNTIHFSNGIHVID